MGACLQLARSLLSLPRHSLECSHRMMRGLGGGLLHSLPPSVPRPFSWNKSRRPRAETRAHTKRERESALPGRLLPACSQSSKKGRRPTAPPKSAGTRRAGQQLRPPPSRSASVPWLRLLQFFGAPRGRIPLRPEEQQNQLPPTPRQPRSGRSRAASRPLQSPRPLREARPSTTRGAQEGRRRPASLFLRRRRRRSVPEWGVRPSKPPTAGPLPSLPGEGAPASSTVKSRSRIARKGRDWEGGLVGVFPPPRRLGPLVHGSTPSSPSPFPVACSFSRSARDLALHHQAQAGSKEALPASSNNFDGCLVAQDRTPAGKQARRAQPQAWPA